MDYVSKALGQHQHQSVEEAIPTLSNRLQHANLSSDRRSAVLGLRSFSRQYRETVVEYGLRPLISTLKRDFSNPDIVKSILETLLILFIRGHEQDDEEVARGWISQQSRIQNGKYQSPLLMDDLSMDQLSIWIADELTQDIEVLQLLLENLDGESDYHIKLYTLQLLESLVATRGTKVKENLLNTPTAMSTICALLGDMNEQVRNEVILLLMAIVNDNFNIQKLVAFENTFDKLFEIIDEEGGIRGSILVQDCLTLITNLLQFNASNQKFFMETQCVPRLAQLLAEPIDEQQNETFYPENGFPFVAPPIIWTEQRIQNMVIALEICRLLVNEDNELRTTNQDILYASGIHYIVLKLVFSPITDNTVRSVALLTAADAISGNSNIQYAFSQIDVPYIDPSMPTTLQTYTSTIPVPMALLNWCLFINSVHAFDIRIGAMYCLQAYFNNNDEAKLAFLQDQIKAYSDISYFENIQKQKIDQQQQESHSPADSHAITTPFGNLFTTLMDYDSDINLNPYKIWFASLTLLHLLDTNRQLTRSVHTGSLDAGEEEVMGSIAAMASLLITYLEKGSDQRIAMGYIQLLTYWIYEDFEAVNDFVSDVSVVTSLLSWLADHTTESNVLISGMATILLGVAYEFSSKDSPTSREILHSLMVKSLGRDNYALKVKQFRLSPAFKDCDDLSMFSDVKDEQGLPKVYFDMSYVQLIKENFPRIKRALWHDPIGEPRGKITYEEFEELDTQVTELLKELNDEKARAGAHELELKSKIDELTKVSADLRGKLEQSERELTIVKEEQSSVNKNLNHTLENLAAMEISKREFETSSSRYFRELQEARHKTETSDDTIKQIQDKLETSESARKKLEDGINKMTRDLFSLQKQRDESDSKSKQYERDTKKLNETLTKSKSSYDVQIEKLRAENKEYQTRLDRLNSQVSNLARGQEGAARELEEKLYEAEATNAHLMDKLRSASVAFTELKEAKTSAEAEYESIKKELESKTGEFDKLNEQYKTKLLQLTNEIEQFKSKGVVTDDVKSLQLEIERKNEEIEIMKEDSELTIDLLKSKNNTLQEKLNSALAAATADNIDEGLNNQLHDTLKKFDELRKIHAYEKSEFETKLAKLETNSDDHASLVSTIEQSTMRIAHLEMELAQADEKSQVLLQEIQALKKEKLSIEESLVAREEMISMKAADMEIKQSEISELNSKIEEMAIDSDLTESLRSAEREIEELRAKLAVATSSGGKDEDDSILQLNLTISTLEEEVNRLKSGSNGEAAESLEAVQDELNSKISMVEELDTLNANLVTELTTARGELAMLHKQLETQSDEITKLKQESESKTTDVELEKTLLNESSEGLIQEYTDKIKQLEDTISANNESHSKMMGEFSEDKRKLIDEIAKLRNEIEVIKESGNDESRLVAEKQVELENAEKQIESLKEQYEPKVEQLDRVTTELYNIKQELEDARNKIHELTSTNGGLKSEDVEQDGQVEKLQALLEARNKELRINTEKYDEINTTLAQLKSDHEHMILDLQSTSNSLKEELDQVSQEKDKLDQLLKSRASELDRCNSRALELTMSKEDLILDHEQLVEKLQSEIGELRRVVDGEGSFDSFLRDSVDRLERELRECNLKLVHLTGERDEIQNELDEIKKDGVNQNDAHETSRAEVKEDEKVLALKLEEEASKKIELQQELDELREVNAKITAQLQVVEGESKTKESKYEAEIKKLKSKLKQSVDQSELDELMLVMADLDESKQKYKQKLKKLGQEVSSDEEEDDDDLL
ncbi:Intracellular protein transport protein USO1 [Spathaspora sp. JA1]|nr:Intracellular protein transport protein USO1 [Spathaspora sp. JA1]